MRKTEIAETLRDGGLDAMKKLLVSLIIECHEDNEVTKEDDFRITQGKIKAYRNLQDYVKKALTGDK